MLLGTCNWNPFARTRNLHEQLLFMRECCSIGKKKSNLIEPGQVIVNELSSKSQLKTASFFIHSLIRSISVFIFLLVPSESFSDFTYVIAPHHTFCLDFIRLNLSLMQIWFLSGFTTSLYPGLLSQFCFQRTNIVQ